MSDLVRVSYDERFLDRSGDWDTRTNVDFFYTQTLETAVESVKRFDTFKRISNIEVRWANADERAVFALDASE
jgi:hypothetical protein